MSLAQALTMTKRKRVRSEEPSSESDPLPERKIKKAHKKDKDKGKKDKKEKKAKKGTKDMGDKHDTAGSKYVAPAKKSKKEDKEGKRTKDPGAENEKTTAKSSTTELAQSSNEKSQPLMLGPAVPASLRARGKPGSKKKDKALTVKELRLVATEAFRNRTKPFGIELDGALVVDLADQATAALAAEVQIGWKILSVNGKAVPADDEGIAAKVLRAAEEQMVATQGKDCVLVLFQTEEPEHWRAATKALKGAHRATAQ